MNTNKKLIITLKALSVLLFAAVIFACSEEEDPFVDRVESPVLIVFDEVPGYLAGGGLTQIPSVEKTVSMANYTNPVVLSMTAYELDKSGILDHTVGIDSIPLVALPITFSKRDGTAAVETETDGSGKVIITTSWEALGITDVPGKLADATVKTITIPLSWRGSYDGQSFTRYSQLVFKK